MPARLESLGIPVVAHRPAVGENLIDHLQLRCTYETAAADHHQRRHAQPSPGAWPWGCSTSSRAAG